jgi:hypothetical protein
VKPKLTVELVVLPVLEVRAVFGRVVSGGGSVVVSTVQVRLAGLLSTMPEESTAYTRKVWGPLESPE